MIIYKLITNNGSNISTIIYWERINGGNMREKYESLALTDLKEIAKARGIKGTSTMKKADLVEAMLLQDEKDKASEQTTRKEDAAQTADSSEREAVKNAEAGKEKAGEKNDVATQEKYPAELDSGITANGILEVMPDGYGFIRCENYLPGENDVYVAPSQIRRFNLKTGDIIEGNTRIKTQSEKFSALLYLKKINGFPPEVAAKRCNFEDMTQSSQTNVFVWKHRELPLLCVLWI